MTVTYVNWSLAEITSIITRNSVDAHNRCDAFSGQSRSQTWYHSIY